MEFLRDLSIIIAGGFIVVWLLVLTVIAVVIYRKVSGTLTAIGQTAQSAQESSRAIRDKLVNVNPGYKVAAVGIGKLGSFFFRSIGRLMKSTVKNKGDSANGK